MTIQIPVQSRNDRVLLLLALAILTFLTAVAMLTRPLTPIDETRYVGVAWEMWLRGDFLVPFKNGEPYSHKPPLMMWMFHLGWWLFGVNEWWPRLVSPLFSAGGLLLTSALANRLWPDRGEVGGRAVIVLASCLLWTIFSTSAMFDVMLAFFVLLGMHGTLLAAEGKPLRGFALLGVAIGLGVLAKGPVILLQVLPVAALAPWWNPGLRWGRWFGGLLAAVFLGAGIALAWAIPAGQAGGEEYRTAIFWGQTANRMVDSFAHRRPVWWYLPLLPVLLFPWFVWPAFWRALAQYLRRGLDRGGRFCLAWIAPIFIAFSLISGKQVHYLVPLFPAFALLVARALSARPQNQGEVPGSLLLPASLVAILGIALIVIALGGVRLPVDEVPQLPPLWPGVALVLVGMAGVWLSRSRRTAPIVVLALLGAALPALIQAAAVRTLYSAYDLHPMARAIRQLQDNGHLIAHTGKYHDQYQFIGRLHRPLMVLQEDALDAWLNRHPEAYAVMYRKDMLHVRGVPAIVTQRYRGDVAVLLNARAAQQLLMQRK